MRKIISLILAAVLVFTLSPALAKTVEPESTETDGLAGTMVSATVGEYDELTGTFTVILYDDDRFDVDLIEKLESFSHEGYRVTNIEMESSALAGMAALLGHDASTVCLAIANRHVKESNPDYKPLMAQLLRRALDSLTA